MDEFCGMNKKTVKLLKKKKEVIRTLKKIPSAELGNQKDIKCMEKRIPQLKAKITPLANLHRTNIILDTVAHLL